MKEYEVFLSLVNVFKSVNSHSLKFKRQKGGFRENSFLLLERLKMKTACTQACIFLVFFLFSKGGKRLIRDRFFFNFLGRGGGDWWNLTGNSCSI